MPRPSGPSKSLRRTTSRAPSIGPQPNVVEWKPDGYWPAHSHVGVEVHALSTGFGTGDAVIGTASISAHTFTVTQNGEVLRTMPASMGKPTRPTPIGNFAALSKERTVVMDSRTIGIPLESSEGYKITAQYAVRVTWGGVYVHSAPWSVDSQGYSNVSHGCINLSPDNAAWYFDTVHSATRSTWWPNRSPYAEYIGRGRVGACMATTQSRAVRFDSYGGPDVLYVADIDRPVPGAGEVLVEVRAAGINPGEAGIRTGALHEQFPATFPSGEGSDLAGVVVEIGDGVSDFAVGDEVLGFSFQRSSHATHANVPIDQLIHKPAQLSWEVAGSLYVVGATAYAAARAVAPQPGETVAVSAAAGGVGSLVVQLLALRDVRVLGIASSSNAEWLRAHGVEPIEYGDGLADRLRQAAPDGVDAFIDLFGPDYVQLASISACRSSGSTPSSRLPKRPRSARRPKAALKRRLRRCCRRSPI